MAATSTEDSISEHEMIENRNPLNFGTTVEYTYKRENPTDIKELMNSTQEGTDDDKSDHSDSAAISINVSKASNESWRSDKSSSSADAKSLCQFTRDLALTPHPARRRIPQTTDAYFPAISPRSVSSETGVEPTDTMIKESSRTEEEDAEDTRIVIQFRKRQLSRIMDSLAQNGPNTSVSLIVKKSDLVDYNQYKQDKESRRVQ